MRQIAATVLIWLTPLMTVSADPPAHSLTVYKTPTCGCCKQWVTHLEANGINVATVSQESLDAIKHKHGITPRLSSCHTGVAAGGQYAFEDHIPAYLVARFLDNPPADAVGLSVPGMHVGSPGMEMGDGFRPFDVLLIKSDGDIEVYQEISAIEQQHPPMHLP